MQEWTMTYGLKALGLVILLLAFLVQKYRLHNTSAALLLMCMTITAAVLVLRSVMSTTIDPFEYVAWEFGAGVLGMLLGFWLADTPEQDKQTWLGRRPAIPVAKTTPDEQDVTGGHYSSTDMR